MLSSPYLTISLLWLCYCAVHSLLAASWWKEMAFGWMGKYFRWYRLIYNIIALAGLIGLILYQSRLPQEFLYEGGVAARVLGILIGAAGLTIMVICIRKYFGDLSGLFQEDNTAGGFLVTSGLHRYMRHPLYSGTFLFLWGGFIAWPLLSILISNSIITLYTLIAIRWEEKKLIDQFGRVYDEYRKKVPMIIPKLFTKRIATRSN